MTFEELSVREQQLLHAMQSGVEYRRNKRDQEPKHLRVGINSALIDSGAVMQVLIDKGILTAEELLAARVKLLEDEVEAYRKEISDELGGAEVNLL